VLIQLTMGAPQFLYNGGLLMAPLRYFDAERKRPGLPSDTAALVSRVTGDEVDVELVNTSTWEAKRIIVQSGTLAEHRFTRIAYDRMVSEYPSGVGTYAAPNLETEEETAAPDATSFEVALPPGTRVRLKIGIERCVNDPTYRFPWG